MARRERTTGLPRARGPKPAKAGARFGEREQRLAALGVLGLLIVVLLGLFGWRYYDENFQLPHKTVLSVNGQKYSLQYYSDRLFLAATQQSGSGTNISILQQTVLTDLENEAVIIGLAKEKGITVSEEDITNEIANQLGVPAGGAGSSFDTLYRQRLKSVKMSDGAYRRYTEAQVYQQKLSQSFKDQTGDKTEMITLRTVVSASQETANTVLALAKTNADFGSIAQTQSTDLASRQKDGVMDPEPARLLPDNIRAAIADKPAGSEILGPVQVETNWWVFKIDARDPQGTLSETQKSQLADLLVKDAVKDGRAAAKIKRDISSSDYSWANDHAGK
ncbi:MAG: SurA N-terminal domain-containing protein [Dehalococcoidia bacterium]|nr:SurA N-terminal domain-containing protein [Dehalococcoidia bacterium]